MHHQAYELHAPHAGSSRVLQMRQTKLPVPAAGEVRVAIEATGVAYADIVMRRGLYEGAKPPVTPGYDLIGRVEEIGEGVAGLVVGQRVAGITVTGSYATHRNVDARWLVGAPETVDAASLVAATLNGVTAWQMLHRIASPAQGESILVHGAAGGVGTMLLDLARLDGIRALGAASPAKHDEISARGATPIDYTREDVSARAREVSGGVVAAFDHIGGAHARRVSMAALRPGGVTVLYGAYDATRDGKVRPLNIAKLMLGQRFSSFDLFRASQGIVGYSVAVWRDHRTTAYRHDLSQVLQRVGAGTIKPLVGATFPLAQAAQAHRALESRAVAGKVVLLT